MYQPKFTITSKILRNIGAIEASREVITNAPLVPYYERNFQKEVEAATIHHSTHIEGNELTLQQVVGVLEGKDEVVGERDAQEIINYRNVLKYLDEEIAKRGETGLSYTESQILKIHWLAVENSVPDEQRGKFRNVQVILRNSQTNEIVFRPPIPTDVPFLLHDFLVWLNSGDGREMHPVFRSGIAHYVIASVHPFTEGDGRTARGFAMLVLYTEQYDIKRLFSLEEYFDRHAIDYYDALRKADLTDELNFNNRDLTTWLEFFTEALAIELGKVKDRVRSVSLDGKIRQKLGGRQVALNERQMKIMEFLEKVNRATMKDLKPILPMISEDTILRELYVLIGNKLVKKVGSRKAATYLLR